MGLLIFGTFLVVLIGGLIPGVGSLLLFWWFHKKKNWGTWSRYILFACVGGLTLAGIGILQLPPESPGAPSGADYAGVTRAAFFIGLAPGGGLSAGCLALFMKTVE